MTRIRNYQAVIERIQRDPNITGADLAREMGLAPRTARRYVANYKSQKKNRNIQKNYPDELNETVVFDIETTDFGTDGYLGRLVCCSFLPLGSNEVETLAIRFEDGGNDKELLIEVAKKLAQYRFHIGHNIATFDYGWLNARLMYHGLEPLDGAVYFDTFQVAKSLAIKTSKSLGNLIDYFGLEGIKTTIYRTSWSKVLSPDRDEFEDGLADIVYHCEHDVKANRNLYYPMHWYGIKNGRTNPWKITKFRNSHWYNTLDN